jgi:hypothetical protein
VMTSFSWFSGNRESSRKCIEMSPMAGVGDQGEERCRKKGREPGRSMSPAL